MALKRHLKSLILFLKIVNITVDSTLVQPSIRRLSNHRFDACTTAELTPVQPLIQRLCNRRFDAYTTVDSTFGQLSNQRLCNSRFDARFETLMYMPLRTWIYFIFSYFISYLDVSCCNFRCLGEFFQMIGKSCKTILLKLLNCKITRSYKQP